MLNPTATACKTLNGIGVFFLKCARGGGIEEGISLAAVGNYCSRFWVHTSVWDADAYPRIRRLRLIIFGLLFFHPVKSIRGEREKEKKNRSE